MRELARHLAHAQSTDEEIAGALAEAFDLPDEKSAALVAAWALDSHRARMAGRADLRRYMWDLARAVDPVLARGATTTTVAAAMMLGRQHLGWTNDGFNAKVQKQVEKLEREKARTQQGRHLRIAKVDLA